ncbi:uncharacterized protein [Pyrus communis]|uniref:uncharacterized protein n=1 Tax=Pyrus communis TaxID=23211 RepID=UPI0035C1CCEF
MVAMPSPDSYAGRVLGAIDDLWVGIEERQKARKNCESKKVMENLGILKTRRIRIAKVFGQSGEHQATHHYTPSAIYPWGAVQRDNFIFALNTVYDNSAVNNLDYSENQVSMSMLVPTISTSLSESHATSKRKRQFSYIMKEKTIEMRQKWMIKNRESAARSRAKK